MPTEPDSEHIKSANIVKSAIEKFRPKAVEKLVRKFERGRAIGVRDNMAVVGILSTQLLVDRFIEDSWSN